LVRWVCEKDKSKNFNAEGAEVTQRSRGKTKARAPNAMSAM